MKKLVGKKNIVNSIATYGRGFVGLFLALEIVKAKNNHLPAKLHY